MKKISVLFIALLLVCSVSSCAKKNLDSKKFKEEYESFNDKKNDYFEYRDLDLEEDNPFVYSTDADIVEKIENNESFIVYFGDPECPWCRSVIEQAIKSANDNNIEKIYYVRFWDGFHKETIRDVYELDGDNNPVLKEKGSDAYAKLIDYLDNVLEDYTLKDSEGNAINVGEKRIFLPNFVSVINGEAKELIEGISENQESYNSDLTKEVIADEKKMFDAFFKEYSKQIKSSVCTKNNSKDC